MHFHLLTLFPDFFTSPLQSSMLKKAQEKGIFSVGITDIRDFSKDIHKKVDDSPYGGGAGMVMRCEPVADAIKSLKEIYPNARVIFLSPAGIPFTQRTAERLSKDPSPKILLCGHYEGIDERVLEKEVDETICVGESIFTGGEIPALAVIDAVTRLLPGTLGKAESHENESFSLALFGAKEYPHYTRPEVWEGISVPDELFSGNHKNIEDWRYENLKGLSEEEKTVAFMRRKLFSPQKPLKGRKFFLRNHIESDIDHWMKWMNSEEITHFLPISPPLSRNDEQWYYDWTSTNLWGLFLTILDSEKNPIGNTSLVIDKERPQVARFGIVLGEKESWGKGLATAITREMLKIAFEELEVQKVVLDVFADNFPAIHIYEKCGFRLVGKSEKQYKKPRGMEDGLFYEKVQ
ncbi:MAG: tRNA (guanosine(37)-N1)-methyltransferase TrmD [Candidatus Peregrinibacteria bacterium]